MTCYKPLNEGDLSMTNNMTKKDFCDNVGEKIRSFMKIPPEEWMFCPGRHELAFAVVVLVVVPVVVW